MPIPSFKVSRREDLAPGAFTRFKERILHAYFVRLDMTLILAVVVTSGLVISKLLLESGVRSLKLRYPIVVLGSYGAFLLLIRVWIWYVSWRKSVISSKLGSSGLSNIYIDDMDVTGGGDDVASEPVRFGGGDFGGGGASDTWDESVHTAAVPTGSSSSGSKGGSKFEFDLGDDTAVLVLLGLLIVAICCAGGYLIYVAPDVLPEAAWQAALASAFARASKPTEHHDWL